MTAGPPGTGSDPSHGDRGSNLGARVPGSNAGQPRHPTGTHRDSHQGAGYNLSRLTKSYAVGRHLLLRTRGYGLSGFASFLGAG